MTADVNHAQVAELPTLTKVTHLDDGSVLRRYSDGSWLIDVPGFGRHELVSVEAAAATLARVGGGERG